MDLRIVIEPLCYSWPILGPQIQVFIESSGLYKNLDEIKKSTFHSEKVNA